MIIGTAGHIDHGKTSLVRALTGVDTDRLGEEKRRGISIDLGYAYLPLAEGRVAGFVDVPGHERFIHNMLAGVTGIDYVMLVVSADDGVMPQTREHLQILDLLQLRRGMIALTKIDRVSAERVIEVEREIHGLLAGTTLDGSPIIPVSVISGVGVAALRARIEEEAAHAEPYADSGHFRLAVDRCFALHGTGTVVTGTVFSGVVCAGEKLILSPAGTEVKVRGLHVQNHPSEKGVRGERCALNLTGPRLDRHAVSRGDWILAEAVHAPTRRLDVFLRLLPSESRSLRHWTPVHIHAGASDVTGRVALLEGSSLKPGAEALAQVILDRPICALRNDRLILRDQSATRTVGGGVVLDAFATAHHRRTPARLAALQALRAPSAADALRTLTALHPDGLALGPFCRNWNLAPTTVQDLRNTEELKFIETPAGAYAYTMQRWEQLRAVLLEALTQAHRQAPEDSGPEAESLHVAIAPALPPAVFNALIETLLDQQSIVREGTRLRLPGHRPALTSGDERMWQSVSMKLRSTGANPPVVPELALDLGFNEASLRALLIRLSRIGRVCALTQNRYLLSESLPPLAATLQALANSHPDRRVSAAEFRDALGTGRKIAIEILEYFDRTGLTQRIGDAHWVREKAITHK